MANNGKDWVIRVLIAICFLLAGFAINVGQVRENTTKIGAMEKTLERIEDKLDRALESK